MLRSFTVTTASNDILTIDLFKPEESGFLVTGIDGLGPVNADINVTDIVTFDGSVYNSARAKNRNIVLNLTFINVDIETQRHLSYKYFPLKGEVTLLFKTDHRLCETTGYVEKNEPDIFSDQESAQISIICPDAWFRDASDTGMKTTDLYGVDPLFEFPFSNESLSERLIEFGRIKASFEASIFYDGEVETGFIMTLHATDTIDKDITITDIDNGGHMVINAEKIKTLTGSYFSAGDDIVISTVKGYKSAILTRNAKTTNILNCLGRDTTWFQLRQGENKFAYQTADNKTIMIHFSITVQNLYQGV